MSVKKKNMTDCAAVNTKFNEHLEAYWSEVLAVTKENWQYLSPEEQASLAKLSNHFCGLHMRVNLIEQRSAVLREFEAMVKVSDASAESGQGEAGEIRLTRTVCKAFEQHGCKQAGRMMQFAEFCQ